MFVCSSKQPIIETRQKTFKSVACPYFSFHTCIIVKVNAAQFKSTTSMVNINIGLVKLHVFFSSQRLTQKW